MSLAALPPVFCRGTDALFFFQANVLGIVKEMCQTVSVTLYFVLILCAQTRKRTKDKCGERVFVLSSQYI